jgi:hypothetical protein
MKAQKSHGIDYVWTSTYQAMRGLPGVLEEQDRATPVGGAPAAASGAHHAVGRHRAGLRGGTT